MNNTEELLAADLDILGDLREHILNQSKPRPRNIFSVAYYDELLRGLEQSDTKAMPGKIPIHAEFDLPPAAKADICYKSIPLGTYGSFIHRWPDGETVELYYKPRCIVVDELHKPWWVWVLYGLMLVFMFLVMYFGCWALGG